MSESNKKSFGWPGVGFLLLVNLIAASFFFSPGTGDVGTWETWMREISSYGVIGGFAHTGTDYPPLAFIILAGVVKSAEAFGVTYFLILKFSLLLFLFGTAACYYWFTRNLVLTAAIELVLILSSIALGYLDIYFAPFLVGGLFLIKHGRLTLGMLLFAISCLIKWQPLIISPFVCIYLLSAANNAERARRPIMNRLRPFWAAALVVAIPLLTFFGPPALFDSFKRATTYHRFLSGYALNLPWIETWALHLFQPEKYGSLQNGLIDVLLTRDLLVVWPNKILFLLIYAVIFFAYARQSKTFDRLIIYSMLGYLAYFSFNTGVHENHLFLVCCLAWILVFVDQDQLLRAINLSIAANANLFVFFGAFGQRLNPVIGGIDITLVFAVANLCLFAGFLIYTVRRDGLDLWLIKIHAYRVPRVN
jgi:hypothetical protein